MRLSIEHAFGGKLPSVGEITYLAGDFWHRLFEGQEDLYALSASIQQEYRQMVRELHEVAAAGGIETVPQYHTETFWPLLVSPQDINHSPYRFGDGELFGDTQDQMTYYGQAKEDVWDVPLPEDLIDAAGATNAIVGGSTWLSEGYDIVFKGRPAHVLEVRTNPFDAFETIIDHRGDEKVRIWLYMARFDRLYMASQFGILLDRYQRSTDSYMRVMRSVLRSQIRGATDFGLREFLAALVNEDVAEAGERVVTVLENYSLPVVVTDRRSVAANPEGVPVVAPGDVLDAGDFFFDTVRFTDFTGEIPSWLSELTFPRAITGLPPKTVPAGDLPLTLEKREDGSQFLAFDGDTAFWDWLDAGGWFIESVLTSLGIPATSKHSVVIASLPTQLDVLAHLAKVQLQFSLSLSQTKLAAIGPDARPLTNLVREVVPPWLHHLLQTDPAETDNDCVPRMPLLS